MAICILLNIDNMYVEEKKTELIVLMINGYSLRAAKGYIWPDTIVLTVIGILFGYVLGSATGIATVRSIERVNSVFIHSVSMIAIVAGTIVTTVLSVIAMMIALKKVDSFKLSDISA
jgi:putative ABC transport system permease protein